MKLVGSKVLVGLSALLALTVPGPAADAQQALTWETVYDWGLPTCIDTTTQMARTLQECMSGVMYPRGTENGARPELRVEAAGFLCRGTRNAENNRALTTCVRTVLYERSGLGNRRDFISGDDAATACRYAITLPQAEETEACMKRQLFTRDGLGSERTQMSSADAAAVCQGSASGPVPQWPVVALCRSPSPEEQNQFMTECTRRLLYTRDGLGARKPDVYPDAATWACEGALSFLP